MQVLTLDKDALDASAARLAELVEADAPRGGFDAIVGVRRGGSIVCDAFCRHFPASGYALRADVALQRPSTKRKSRVVGKILRALPLPVLDLLRMGESGLLAMKHRCRRRPPAAQVSLPEALRLMLKRQKIPEILIIDDAIDSGDTLFGVIHSLKEVNPRAVAKVAVVTVTTRRPRVDADYHLYHNRTLIRFPWSDDYKK